MIIEDERNTKDAINVRGNRTHFQLQSDLTKHLWQLHGQS
jgi:hypothetical protein